MNVPQGQSKIARRFNAGVLAHGHQSLRDGRKQSFHGRRFGRPGGTLSILSRPPAVKNGGYCHSPRRGGGARQQI